MDPDKPKSEETKDAPKPTLTERQRIEARKQRRARRRRPVQGNPLSRGMRATGLEIRRTAAFLGQSVIAGLAALGPVFSSVGMGLVWLIGVIGKGLRLIGRGVERGLAAVGRGVAVLDRVVTPHRALLLVGLIAAVLLGVSQYKGLGATEIGQPGYSGIEDLVRAPALDHTTPAGVHTRIFVPIAAIAFAAVLIIALGGRFARWRRIAAMTLTMIGLLTIAVALLVDLPDAKDVSELELAYAGVRAVLLSGFWLELAAGATLAVTGLALLLEPSKQPAASSRRERRPSTIAGSRA
ncbi:MAG: hypothetical protein J0H98_11795 [Solirubrobacterales bacterium]|nr:hypothetical protein [Solirubrobacterales bacterium]